MVQNKVGRPKKFERETALNAAVEVFWEKGYNGASLDDLTKAMGINRPSLYSTFRNKQSLFLEALAAYGAGVGVSPLAAFTAENDPTNAVTAFLGVLLDNQTRAGGLAQGCLLASCATTVAKEIEGVSELLKEGDRTALALLENGFEAFKKSNQLPPDFPSKAKARLMLDMMHGFAYRSRLGEKRRVMIAEISEKTADVISILQS